MQILVIGGAGFIGSHLSEKLQREGHRVRIFDNFSTGRRENLSGLDVEIVEGEITNFDQLHQAMAGCDQVFHQAALVSVPQSIKEPALNHNINVEGAYNVFEAARQHGIKRVVYASSAAVYGDVPELPCQIDATLNPISPYAAAKLINEIYAATYNRTYGTEFIGLRYFNVYGPRQDPSSPYSGFLSICCNRIVTEREITIFGDGEQTRDFIYVSDVVQANIMASEMAFSPSNTIFNVATGHSVTLNKVIGAFNEISNNPIQVKYGPARDGDILHSEADVSQTYHRLGFRAKTSLQLGLKETLTWYQTKR